MAASLVHVFMLFAALSALAQARQVQFHTMPSESLIPSLESAIELAAASRAAGQQVVIAVIMAGGSSKYFMPTYIESLRVAGNLDEHLVMLNLDVKSQAYCAKAHNPDLCPIYQRNSVPKSVEELLTIVNEEELSEQHHFPYFGIGWLKTWLIKAILSKGHNCLATDTDLVFFKNPFPYFDPDVNVVSTSDQFDGWSEEKRMDVPDPNLGIAYFKAGDVTSEFVRRWLLLEGGWDQIEFRNSLVQVLGDTSNFKLQMLSLKKFPTFCYNSQNGLHDALAERSKGWTDVCPKEIRDEWVAFHVACARTYWDWHDSVHDLGLVKRDMLTALLDLQGSSSSDFVVEA